MTPKAYAALGAVVLLLLSAIGSYFYGRHDGVKVTEAGYLKRDNNALREANKKISDLNEKVRASERKSAQDLADASAAYQRGIRDVELRKDHVIAGMRAELIRLRDPGRHYYGIGTPKSPPGTAAAGCDGGGGAELSIEFSEFLIGAFSRADKVARQLKACQVILVKDREVCGGE